MLLHQPPSPPTGQALALQEALAALGESERRTATILEALSVGIVVTDADGVMSYTNPAAVALGIETPRDDDGDPLPYFDAYTCVGEPYPDAFRPLARALHGAIAEADDMVVRGPGNSEIPIDCRATPMRNDDGAIVGAVAVVRDLRAERAAQAALRESEARYRDLVEHSGEILTTHALDGRLLSVNPAMLRSLRMRADEMPANLGDLVPVHHREGFQQYLARVRREGRADGVGTVVASDGTHRIWQFHSSIRREGVAEPVVRSIATDVTDARMRERLLADRETRLRHAQKIEAVGKLAGGIAHDFNNILTVIAGHLALVRDDSDLLAPQSRADLDEVTRAVDRATRLTRRLLGFSRKQLLSPRVVDANVLIAELEPMLARVLDERIAFAAHPSPSPAWINIDPSVLESALVNLAVNARDAMPDGGTLTVDTAVRGPVVTIAVRDSGTGMDPDTLARAGEPFFTTKRAGVGTGLGLAMINGSVVASDGTRRIWQFHSSIRREGLAEPVVRSIATDITDARTRERLLADRETRLRHAQKIEAVGKLAGGIAHDFNNILTVIAGHLALVRDDSHLLPSQARADLDEVTRAVDRASRLTRRLLGFSRKQVLSPRVVDANVLIAELEPMLARVLDERIAFAAHPSPTPARINIDPSVLEGALVNLAVNARDAMPNGGTLTVDTVVRDAMVTIAVRDSGTGMDPETLARVGEPFFTTKGAGVGTGLGLAMIYGSVEQSGGAIRIESTPGTGTVVHLLFPLAAGETDAGALEPSAPGGLHTAHREASSSVRPVSVLVVEDEDPLRRLVERILVREGYHVTVARHGADALHIASTLDSPIELVITDLVMPELGGREVAESLRAGNPSLPVLFISGYDPDPVVLGSSDQANTAFLAKPFTGGALLDQVRQLAPTRREGAP